MVDDRLEWQEKLVVALATSNVYVCIVYYLSTIISIHDSKLFFLQEQTCKKLSYEVNYKKLMH